MSDTVPVPGTETERVQRAMLRRHRSFATALLLVMAAIYLAARSVPEPGFWIGLIAAGAEAGIVGGLADWFAVTALFRRPLGLPIPHTALVRRHKERIGEGFAGFVERHFLAPDLVLRRLRSAEPAARLGRWLAEPAHAESVASHIAEVLPHFAAALEDPPVRAYVRQVATDRLRAVELAPILGKVLAALREAGHHDLLFDRALGFVRENLERNRDTIAEAVGARRHRWIPKVIDRQIAQAIVGGIADLLDDAARPDHELRRTFDRTLADGIIKLQFSQAFRERVEAIKDQTIDSPAVQNAIGALWDELHRALVGPEGAGSPAMRTALADRLRTFGEALATDAALQHRVDDRIEGLVHTMAASWRGEIGEFLAGVIRQWDTDVFADRIELAVGRDLQYIRMNGTLVGALVGCLLYLFALFVL